MFVGYTLAVLAILGTAKVAVALLVLGVPIIDTFWIIVRRLATGHSPFTPDRGHIHHRLLDIGLSPRADRAGDLRHLHPARGACRSSCRGPASCTRSWASSVAFGLALFLLTRGESGDALEADSYEASCPEARASRCA